MYIKNTNRMELKNISSIDYQQGNWKKVSISNRKCVQYF